MHKITTIFEIQVFQIVNSRSNEHDDYYEIILTKITLTEINLSLHLMTLIKYEVSLFDNEIINSLLILHD